MPQKAAKKQIYDQDEDEVFAEGLKKAFFAQELDLMDEQNFNALIKIFRKEDKKAEEAVHKARQSQIEFAEY